MIVPTTRNTQDKYRRMQSIQADVIQEFGQVMQRHAVAHTYAMCTETIMLCRRICQRDGVCDCTGSEQWISELAHFNDWAD